MNFFVRIYMHVCKKMVIYLGIKTPQSRKERKYTWQKTHVYRVPGMVASIRGKKTARIGVYRVIILKQMADHIHDVLRKTFLKVTISKTKLLNDAETSFRRGVRQTQTAGLQTADLQTCRLTDTFGTHGGRGVIDQYLVYQYLVFGIFYCLEELVTVRQLLPCNPQGGNLLTFIHSGGRLKTDLASGTHEDKNSHDLLKSQKM